MGGRGSEVFRSIQTCLIYRVCIHYSIEQVSIARDTQKGVPCCRADSGPSTASPCPTAAPECRSGRCAIRQNAAMSPYRDSVSFKKIIIWQGQGNWKNYCLHYSSTHSFAQNHNHPFHYRTSTSTLHPITHTQPPTPARLFFTPHLERVRQLCQRVATQLHVRQILHAAKHPRIQSLNRVGAQAQRLSVGGPCARY